ncbi:MAG: ABC transporter permease, partial [Bacteroidota bacterium]
MLFNYIKIAFRNLFRQKLYAGINILGLSLGMSICILVLLFVRNEYQYDKWYENSDRIYRFTGSFKYDGEVEPTALSPRPLARMLADELPEVEAATHVLTAWNEWLVKSEGIEFYTDQYARVDSTFFDVFAMPFAHGNRTTIFDQPDQVVLSKDFAQRIFGEENPMGKVLNIRNRKDFIVAGVLEKSQGPSHFGFDLYLPLRQRTPRDNDWVSNFNYYTYARLNQPIELLALNDKVRRLYDERKRPILQAEGEEADASFDVNVSAQRLTDIYLHSQLDNEIQASGDIRYVYVYTIIAIIILLIACINFMNLSTARSARRAREVGVRKVVGASRLMSSGQFLIEALIQSFLALGLGFILVELFLPIFSSILEKKIYLPAEQVPSVLVICFFMALITGLLAGSYPAIFLSGFQPIRVLKGDFSKSKE